MTDHFAEAQMYIDSEYGSVPNSLGYETADVQHLLNMMAAQTHATLALAEQQRIANLITLSGWVADGSAEDAGYDLDKLRRGVAGEVWEALGLAQAPEAPEGGK